MEKFIMSIDSGGQGIRCLLFNKKGEMIQKEYQRTPAEHPSPGAEEHDPILLRDSMFDVVRRVLDKQKITASEVEAIGISNQRASFLLWEKETGKPLCNLISWADVRAAKITDQMNKNKKWQGLKNFAKVASKLTGSKMLTATSMLKFTTDHVPCRLNWFFSTHPEIKKRCETGEVLFGTLDTWFVYSLTKGEKHLTDMSNAVTTSLFNPFQLKWNEMFFNIFDIPSKMFPSVIDTNGDFGLTDPELFGAAIPIRCVIGDQMGALFGHCCFEPGEIKISQGSGAFVDMNVGHKPGISKRGLFPLLAWSIDGKPTYMLEGFVATAGTLINWLGNGIGLSSTGPELDSFAEQCDDTDGVICLPTPAGIRFPYFNPDMRACILGLSLSTHRKHVARAVLEGIALRLVDIITGMKKDAKQEIASIKVDGGLSKSNVLLESLANFANITVRRASEPDLSGTGAAYMAGLATGYWASKEELLKIQEEYTIFAPSISDKKREQKLRRWNKSINSIMKIDKKPIAGRRAYQDRD